LPTAEAAKPGLSRETHRCQRGQRGSRTLRARSNRGFGQALSGAPCCARTRN